MILLVGLVWPCVLGFVLVKALGRDLGLLSQVSLAPALGIGAISSCFFLELESGVPALLFEVLLLAGAGAVGWRTGWRGVKRPVERKVEWWLGAALALVLAGAAYGFSVTTWNLSLGGWDAWAIWNLHARFLATPYWRDLFSPAIPWTHPDYPLLLSGFVARVWSVGGEPDPTVPRAMAFLFTFGTVGLLGGTVGLLNGRKQGLVAALFLAATPSFIELGAEQYADIPLSLFILATVALQTIGERFRPEQRSLPILTGLCAGFAAWTKNEGLLFVVVAVPMFALTIRRQWGRMLGLVLGLAPMLALVLFFRLTLATPNANLGGRPLGALASLLMDANRWRVMLVALVKEVGRLGGLPIGAPLVLAAYVACRGIDARRDRTSLRAGVGILAAMVAGYAAVCVLSPYDIRWQTATALPRLLLQLWPATLFLVFEAMKVGGVEEAKDCSLAVAAR